MRGIPHDPVDGTKYSGLFQGVPVVLEYDSDTGGYKLVVDVEGSLDVNMTGVTVAIGVIDTELPAAAALGDADANPTAPAVGSFLMAYDEAGDAWDRVRGGPVGEPSDLGEWSPTMRVSALAFAVSPSGEGYRLRVDPGSNLHVTMVSGSFPAGSVLSDALPNPSAPAVGAYNLGYDKNIDEWRRIPVILYDDNANVDPAGVGDTWLPLVIAGQFTQSDDDPGEWHLVQSDLQRRMHSRAFVTGSVSLESGKTIQRAVINVSGSGGEQTLVAAAGGSLKIKVLEVMLISDAAVKALFQSGFTGTALTGPMSLPADGDGFFLNSPANRDMHHFETAANQALVLDLSAAAAIGGWINYYTEA